MTKLKCYKCGGSLLAKENHNIAVCQECNSLILLPSYVFDKNIANEVMEKVTISINKAIEYQLKLEFHKAYNTYDKLQKNFLELKDQEYFFYYGKFMAQYGIIYHYNRRLENELLPLQINTDNVFENENYKKAFELMDFDTQILLKKEVTELENKISNIYHKTMSQSPFDVLICVDDTRTNPAYDVDVKTLKEVISYLDKNGISYKTTKDLFQPKNRDSYLEKMYPLWKNTEMMIVISHNFEQFNASFFRHTWMSFYRLEEIRNERDIRFMIIGDQFTDYEEYTYCNNYQSKILDNLQKIKNIKMSLEVLPLVEETIKAGDYKAAKTRLNNAKQKDYKYWWSNLLVKYEVQNMEELRKKNIPLEKDYYFRQTFLQVPKPLRKELYELYANSLTQIEASYEEEVSKLLKKMMMHKILNFSKWSLLLTFYIVICFVTISLKNTLSLIIFIILLSGITIPLIISILEVLKQGKTDMHFDSEKDRQNYYHQMSKIMKPEKIVNLIPYSKQKMVNAFVITVIVVLLLGITSFISKEVRLAIKYNNLEYYYVLDKAYINGGEGKNIVIPQSIGDKVVVRINQGAFENNDKIETLEINYGLTEIGSHAFYNCGSLRQVILPASLLKVGNSPFEECNNLVLLRHSGKITDEKLLGEDYLVKMLNLKIEKNNQE